MNRNFILMQPVSKSELICTTCVHLYDPNFNICTCHKSENEVSQEYLKEGGKIHIRRVVPFKEYLKDKYGGK